MDKLICIGTFLFLAACARSEDGHSAADSIAVSTKLAAATTSADSEAVADSIGSSGVPTAVADVGTYGEDLYDAVKLSDWAKATAILDSVTTSAKTLRANEKTEIASALNILHSAVPAHQRNTAIESANEVTRLAAAFSEAYHPKTPPDIVRLDYYGRELEIWAARGDTARLATTRGLLEQSWISVKSSVISHGGTTAAAHTDALVKRLAAAHSAADYSRLATPILDVVDELEKPFEK